MAGVPCVNDTCSVVSTVDANGRLNLDVRLNPNGGIQCTDGVGLGLTSIPSHVVLNNSMPARSTLTASDTEDFLMTLTNPTANPVLVVADLRYDFRFTYLASGDDLDDRYYSFDIGYDLLLDGLSVLAGGSFAETLDGIGRAASAGSDQRAKARKSSAVFTLIPGVHSLIMRASRSGLGSGTVGTITATGPSNGILMNIRLAASSINTGNTTTLT